MRNKAIGFLFLFTFLILLWWMFLGANADGNTDKKNFLVSKLLSSHVFLESITFNHQMDVSDSDALDIRKNWEEEVRIPEWEKSKPSFPAAYIHNKNITVKAVFSIEEDVDMLKIGARTISGDLGDIAVTPVPFKNGHSEPVYFEILSPTPEKIHTFEQQWEWYYVLLSNSQNVDEKHVFANSTNKIYIVLAVPQTPWGDKKQTEAWTDVLDYSCQWAKDESTTIGVANRITHGLYNDIGALYYPDSDYTDSTRGAFLLTEFLGNFPEVSKVNCYAMGKAQVIFANILGCGMQYRYYPYKMFLNCVKLVGDDERNCRKSFNDHGFGALGRYVFESSFKLDSSAFPDHWLTNLKWEDYIQMIEKEDLETMPIFPDAVAFPIDGNNSDKPLRKHL